MDERLLTELNLQEAVSQTTPPPDYLALKNRARRRIGDAADSQIFPVYLPDAPPVIPIPLRQHQKELPLDIQFSLNGAYDSGPYWRGAVDYEVPPEPPLPGNLNPWVEELVRHWMGSQSRPSKWFACKN